MALVDCGGVLSVAPAGELICIIEREQSAFAARRASAAVDQLPIVVIEAGRKLTFGSRLPASK